MTTPAASPGAGESWKRSQEFPVRPAVTRQSSRPPAWGALKDGAAPRAGENYYKAVPVPMVRDPVLSIGSTFAGGYEVLAQLGEGSFGRVGKGPQRATGPAFAVKTLPLRQVDAARAHQTPTRRL